MTGMTAEAAVTAACEDPVAPGSVRLLRLGQAGVVLRGPEATVLVDPWISPDPGRLPPVVDPAALTRCDLVLITHDHSDHADLPAIARLAAAHPAARFAAPPILEGPLLGAGVDPRRLELVGPGDAVGVPGATATAVAAQHAATTDEPYAHGRAGRVDFLGFAVHLGVMTVFHAGDTLWWPGLEVEIARHRPDVALLPVNGRDVMREREGLVGCLDAREAVALAAAAGVPRLVPIHHDGFAANPGDPAAVVRAAAALAPTLQVLVLPALTPCTLARD